VFNVKKNTNKLKLTDINNKINLFNDTCKHKYSIYVSAINIDTKYVKFEQKQIN